MSKRDGSRHWTHLLARTAVCLWHLLASVQAQPLDRPIELSLAQRDLGGAAETVRLPDAVRAPDGAAPPLRATYRMRFQLGAVPPGTALYLPGLRAHARVRLNGHVVADALGDPMEPLPRSLRSIRLIDVPPEFLQRGDNTLEIEAAGRSALSVSPAWLGPRDVLEARYEWRLLGAVQGPALVAVAIGSLALCATCCPTPSSSRTPAPCC